jgi:hypothetical protein
MDVDHSICEKVKEILAMCLDACQSLAIDGFCTLFETAVGTSAAESSAQ